MRLKVPLIIFIYWFETLLFAAEAGMPQLDSKYWFSQSFWLILIFLLLYLSLSKFFIPKIKNNLDDREKKIKDNLDEAKELSELAEKKNLDYENEISNAKGVYFYKGIGEIPFLEQATISLWDSIDNVKEFAYKNNVHRSIIKKTKSESWYSEELFCRFYINKDYYLK